MKEKKKKINDSGHICKLTASWKAPSTQIRIFFKPQLYTLFTWIDLPSGIPSTRETSESSYRNIRLIKQQNGNISWRQESARKGLNATSGAQFAALSLVKPVAWFARVVVNWRSRSIAKSARYLFETALWSRFKAPSIRIQVKSYAVSKVSLDSCACGLKEFKVAFAESSLECPCKPRSQFLPPHSKVHGAHSFISAKKVLQAVVLLMK